MTWVTPLERGLGERLGRSRKSGNRSSGTGGPWSGGILTAADRRPGAAERRRQLALDGHGDVGERARLPLGPQQPEDVDVVVALAVAVPVAQEALVAEADRQQRGGRAGAARGGVRAEPMHAEQGEGEVGDERLGLAVGAGAPEAAPQPRADHAAQVAHRQLGEPGDPGRPVLAMDDQQVEALAALALDGAARDEGAGLVDA